MMCRKKNIIIILFVMIIVLVGCGYYESYDKAPDNDFSSRIKEEFGESYYYQETRELPNGVVQYSFLIREYNDENILELVNLANTELIGEKVFVGIYVEFAYGTEYVFGIGNYSDSSLEYPDYDEFSYLNIGCLQYDHDPFWDDVSIYYSLPDIRYLRISDRLQEYADTQGIDWYEIWPDLEEVEVYDTSNWGKG